MKHGGHRLGEVALTHAHAPTQVTNGRLQTWTKIARRHIGGPSVLGLGATRQTL